MGPNKCLKTVHFSSCHENWSVANSFGYLFPHILRRKLWKFPQLSCREHESLQIQHFFDGRGWWILRRWSEDFGRVSLFVFLFQKISCMFGDILVIFEPFLLNPTWRPETTSWQLITSWAIWKGFILNFPDIQVWFVCLGGGFKYILFPPRTLGNWSNLTSIFFKWIGSTEVQPPTSSVTQSQVAVTYFCALCWWLKPIEIQLVGSFCDRTTKWLPIRIGFDFNKYPR